ncbi:MAG: peptidoglycan-binding protein [Candidatus Paceibacterota bacterium]
MSHNLVSSLSFRFFSAIAVLVSITLFAGTARVFGAASTTAGMTEFLPIPDETVITDQSAAQTRQMLEMFRGLIPDATIDSFSALPAKNTAPSGQTAQTASSGNVFTKDLKLGDTDPQVLLLQKFLNEDPDTMVAESGAGSPGNETTYFGQKTKTAVIKLQNKHYGEVLAPNGLATGTGYFGPSTRAMANNMKKTAGGSGAQTSGISAATTIPRGPVSGLGEKVKIESLEPTHGKSGTSVTIHGAGMSKTANKIIFGGQTVYNATSADGKSLVFSVESPASFPKETSLPVASSTYIIEHFNELKTKDFPELKYPVCVQNDTGMSNCAFFTIDF